MKCPVCDVDLVMTERSQVEIDYCPKCRGIWLDRGELDKIIERAAQMDVPPSGPQGPLRWGDDDDDHHHRGGDHHGGYGYRRKSWWQELFD